MPRKENKESAKDAASKAKIAVYEQNAKVLCRHLDNLYYESKIMTVEHAEDGEPVYMVHYQGWNQRHDEKIPHSATLDRFLEYTPANVEKAKTEIREAQARLALSKKKGRKSMNINDEKKSGPDSRGSTPSEKRGASSSRAASTISEKATSTTTPLTAIRKRKSVAIEPETNPDFVRKSDIKIDIPMVLRDVLFDDHDLVNRQMYLLRIPARVTVAEIIKQYADYMGTCVDDQELINFEFSGDNKQLKTTVVTLIQSSHGIQDYFDSSLGSQLLYKFERPQYADLVAENKTKETNKSSTTKKRKAVEASNDEASGSTEDQFKASNCYGFIHLLRLFVRFGHMLELTSWDDRAIQTILNHVHNFLKFLEVNRHKFLDMDQDYHVASPDYQRRVWST